MFADMVGSRRRSDRNRLIRGHTTTVLDVVRTADRPPQVLKLIGDGIMLSWPGAELAEDLAAAFSVATEIIDCDVDHDAEQRLGTGIGMAHGSVTEDFAPLADRAMVNYLGDPVTIAAFLVSIALPRQVLVTTELAADAVNLAAGFPQDFGPPTTVPVHGLQTLTHAGQPTLIGIRAFTAGGRFRPSILLEKALHEWLRNVAGCLDAVIHATNDDREQFDSLVTQDILKLRDGFLDRLGKRLYPGKGVVAELADKCSAFGGRDLLRSDLIRDLDAIPAKYEALLGTVGEQLVAFESVSLPGIPSWKTHIHSLLYNFEKDLKEQAAKVESYFEIDREALISYDAPPLGSSPRRNAHGTGARPETMRRSEPDSRESGQAGDGGDATRSDRESTARGPS